MADLEKHYAYADSVRRLDGVVTSNAYVEMVEISKTRIANLEAENALLVDAVQVLRQELSRIADAASVARRLPIRDLREKLHAN